MATGVMAGQGDALTQVGATRIYRRYDWPHVVQSDLTSLRQFDAEAERLSRRRGAWCAVGWVATVISLFVGSALPPLFVVTVILLVVSIVLTVRWRRAKARDLENRRYELCARLLDMLGPDLDAAQPVQIQLDLRAADHPAKLTGETNTPPWKNKHYVDPWLWLQAALLDGGRLTLRCTERKRVRRGWKRGSSGKMKRKVKAKSKHEVAVQVAVKPAKHPNIDALAKNGRGAVQLPHFLTAKAIDGKKGQIRLKAAFRGDWYEPGPEADEYARSVVPRASVGIAAMLLSVYQVIHLSRRLHKRHKGSGHG